MDFLGRITVKEGRARWRTLMSPFIVAVLLNYPWEFAQAPLYVGWDTYSTVVWWHCFVASLGAAVMVLLVVAVGRIYFRQWDWFQRPGVTGYLVMLTAGLVLALLVEWVAVHLLWRWEYTGKMPTLPGLGIGLVPIVQMLILPPLIFRIAAVFGARKTV